tara:strand:+ start:12481 stop:13470 length:990 start_codon:yes stop_codon:yes gene_type:complete
MNLPAENYGGIERVIVNLAHSLMNCSVAVKVLCTSLSNDSEVLESLLDSSSINEKTFSEFKYHSNEYAAKLILYISENINENDVVILNHIEQRFLLDDLKRKTNNIYEIVHYRNTAISNNLIFPSKLYKYMTLKSGVVIPHPCSTEEFYRMDDEIPIISEPYLLCVGRVCKNKRTHLAYEIAKKLDIKCVLAGPIHDEDYAKDFIHNCTYLGNVDSSKLRNLYSHATISACLTNILPPETYGLFQVEALLCGSPVVSSCYGGLSDTKNKYGVIRYNDLRSIEGNVSNIKRFLGSFDEELRRKSISYTVSNFTSDPIAQKYLKHIYKKKS